MASTAAPSTLTTVQQCVANALAAGSTLTAAAEQYGLNRATVYRWIKTHQPFSVALRHARADFVLARRDALFELSNRALETLMAILNNPAASPAVQLRTAVFVLTRPQLPDAGWSLPQPVPDPHDHVLIDSATIEQDYDKLPGLFAMEDDFPAGSAAEEPAPPTADATSCNEMQHDSRFSEDVAPTAPIPFQPPADATPCNEMQQDSRFSEDVAPTVPTPAPPLAAATSCNEMQHDSHFSEDVAPTAPIPAPPPADATPCNEMQHDSHFSEGVAPTAPIPAPPAADATPCNEMQHDSRFFANDAPAGAPHTPSRYPLPPGQSIGISKLSRPRLARGIADREPRCYTIA